MSKADQLSALYQQLEAAAPTLPLATKATDIVPGEGNPAAEIMFIGEAPGEQEAKLRRPFVGRSGQLFRATLRQVGTAEKDVYISNIVKVRPPENRDPLPTEIAAYKPYLDQEIEIIQPLLIATLGRFSMGKFLPNVKVSQVHGRLHKVKWNGKTLYVLPMYHPAAALRAPKVKESFIQDFQKLTKVVAWIKGQHESAALQAEVAASLF
ncbi:MAG TPA: uracil-DNA glycosylase [Vitreimonas sp.]|nr:uracil-DNA glycosylase [Vitreimonas sp.]